MTYINLWIHTVRFLNSRQVLFQVIFRLKKLNLFDPKTNPSQLHFLKIKAQFVPVKKCVLQTNPIIFEFINVRKTFQTSIDWKDLSSGQLWKYHLQYASFLLDSSVPSETRYLWLQDLNTQILNNLIKLEAYPCSIRIIHSLLFLHLTDSDPNFNKALTKQLHWLKKNLEYHIDANHLLMNRIALSLAEIFLGNESKSLTHTQLIYEIDRQTLKDGAHYERSLMYHLEILEMLMILYSCIQHKNSFLKSELSPRIGRWVQWLDSFTDQGKLVPNFNDCTLNLSSRISDILECADKMNIKQGISNYSISSFHILSFGKNQKVYIQHLTPGPVYQAGHAHADILHFIWFDHLQPVFCDTGISTYENSALRLSEKSSGAHNTVTVENRDQSQIWSSFRMAKRAKVEVLEMDNHNLKGTIRFAGNPVLRHQRQFQTDDQSLTIDDQIFCPAHTTAIARFYVDRNVIESIKITEDNKIRIHSFEISFTGVDRIEIKDCIQSLDFNQRVPSKKIEAHFTNHLVTKITSIA